MTDWSIVGCISGTSADGIDLAEIGTDGETIHRFGPTATGHYRQETRKAVLDSVAEGPADRSGWAALSDRITADHVEALGRFIAERNLNPDFLSVHGQTVWHDPEIGETIQLGNPQAIANALNIPVVSDLRAADMAAGGEGAPIVPVYHRALARASECQFSDPLCFLNIGGVSNLTYIDHDQLLAFDIGPGNALLDDWVREHGTQDFDRDGIISARGQVDEARLSAALTHPFFAQQPPKSLDRNAFSFAFCQDLSVADGAATLAAFTAAAVQSSVALLPDEPRLWIVCGGGRRNPTIMAELSKRLAGQVESSDAYGIDGDALEAQAMAFLGARLRAGLPTTYPGTTGARQPVVGGVLYQPAP